MNKKELERKVLDLETSISNLRSRLVQAKVLRSIHDPYSTRISLQALKDQINGIKDFLKIKYVTDPAIPAKSVMKKITTSDPANEPKTETQSKWATETWNEWEYMVTVCDKCSELLKHRSDKSRPRFTEIRVESCPDCRNKSKDIIRGLLGSPDLNLEDLEEETVRQIDRALEWLKKNERP